MIKEAYCSYELSKLLKEKGFDEPCLQIWECESDKKYLFRLQSSCYQNITEKDSCLAPTHQMAMAWLREKHHIHANPIRQGNYDDCSDYYTWIVASNGIIHRNQSVADKLSYDDAVEEACLYALKNLIK